MDKNYLFTCSAAAYLISKKGMQIMLNEKIYYHYDLQINFANLKIYKSIQKLFKTYELESSANRSNNSVYNLFNNIKLPIIDTPDDRGISFWLGFKAIRIFNIEFSVLDLILIFIVIIIIIIKI